MTDTGDEYLWVNQWIKWDEGDAYQQKFPDIDPPASWRSPNFVDGEVRVRTIVKTSGGPTFFELFARAPGSSKVAFQCMKTEQDNLHDAQGTHYCKSQYFGDNCPHDNRQQCKGHDNYGWYGGRGWDGPGQRKSSRSNVMETGSTTLGARRNGTSRCSTRRFWYLRASRFPDGRTTRPK